MALKASRETQPFIPFLIGTDHVAEFKGLWSCDLFEGRNKGNPTICSLARIIQQLPAKGTDLHLLHGYFLFFFPPVAYIIPL